jgi:perosamine synthetase
MSEEFVNSVVAAIRSVTGGPSALHAPIFQGLEGRYVQECIDTGWVSSVGAFVDRLESELCRVTGADFAIATVNGTSALHIALLLAGVQRNEEVIVPALSFVGTANAVSYCGAVPHFVDVSSKTLGMDAQLLEEHLGVVAEVAEDGVRNLQTGRRIAAIIPMHTFGHPCDMAPLVALANRYRIPLVEDAAESLGSFYQQKHTGTFGRLGILSFNGNKIVTSGGGGAILTNDPALARQAKQLTTTAKVPHKWEYIHDCAGFNYRMPNINAALACAQLEQLQQFVEIKRSTAMRYQEAFAGIDGVTVIMEPDGCISNYWLNAIRLDGGRQQARDLILQATNDAGLQTRPCWTPLNRLAMYQGAPASSLRTTDELYAQIINVPSGVEIGLPRTGLRT